MLFDPLEPRRLLSAAPTLPRYDHVVVVMEENHDYKQVIGSSATDDPYIQSLAAGGLLLTNSHAVAHPSEPNYLALFCGSTRGVSGDAIPRPIRSANLATRLEAAGLSFAGYAESLPYAGFTDGDSGDYVQRHAPWTQFSNVPASADLPFADFPTDYQNLPTVSFVVPNLQHDMHDGTIAQADQWLGDNIGPYASWAKSHNSLLIVTWDENDGRSGNHVATIFYGAGVQSGQYARRVNHYNVLRTIEAIYGVRPLGQSASAKPVSPL